MQETETSKGQRESSDGGDKSCKNFFNTGSLVLWFELVDCPHRIPPDIPIVCTECGKIIE